MHRQAPCAMLMMRRLAQLLAAVELMRTCIVPVDPVRGAGRSHDARVRAPSTRAFKRYYAAMLCGGCVTREENEYFQPFR